MNEILMAMEYKISMDKHFRVQNIFQGEFLGFS